MHRIEAYTRLAIIFIIIITILYLPILLILRILERIEVIEDRLFELEEDKGEE